MSKDSKDKDSVDLVVSPGDTIQLTLEDNDVVNQLRSIGVRINNSKEAVTVLVREYKHMREVANNTDNQLRSYFRKNLPRNPHSATMEERELIYAEQRFIRAAKKVSHLITSLKSDDAYEFNLALGNLEKQQVLFPDLFKDSADEYRELKKRQEEAKEATENK